MTPLDHKVIATRIECAAASAVMGVVIAAGSVVMMLADDWRGWLGMAVVAIGFLGNRSIERVSKDLHEAIGEAQAVSVAVRGEGAPTRKGGDGTAAPSSPSPPPTT